MLFCLVKNCFFIYQIFKAVKTVSPMGNVFLTNFSFQLMETNFLSSRNSIVLFRALLKILKNSGVATFLRETLFLLVETDFLASRSYIVFSIFQILLLMKSIFCLAETYF